MKYYLKQIGLFLLFCLFVVVLFVPLYLTIQTNDGGWLSAYVFEFIIVIYIIERSAKQN